MTIDKYPEEVKMVLMFADFLKMKSFWTLLKAFSEIDHDGLPMKLKHFHEFPAPAV